MRNGLRDLQCHSQDKSCFDQSHTLLGHLMYLTLKSIFRPGEAYRQQPWSQYKEMTPQTPCIPPEYCFPKLYRLYLMKYFSKFFLREHFWKTNFKAHTGPFRPGIDLYQAWLEHRTYINRTYSPGDRTMLYSILTVYLVIYIIVQGKYYSKHVTSMNDLTTRQ